MLQKALTKKCVCDECLNITEKNMAAFVMIVVLKKRENEE